MEQEVFSLEEAASYLGLSRVSLARHARGGAVPGFKVGHLWRFRKDALDLWMRERIRVDTAARSSKCGAEGA